MENQSLLGKHSNRFKNITPGLKNDPFNKVSLNDILYFASIYLKRTFDKKSYEIGSIRYDPGIKYLLNKVQHVQ